MLPHERKLLTDGQLREASRDQIEDLVQRLNLILRERGEPGQLVWSLAPEEPAGGAPRAPTPSTRPPSDRAPRAGTAPVQRGMLPLWRKRAPTTLWDGRRGADG